MPLHQLLAALLLLGLASGPAAAAEAAATWPRLLKVCGDAGEFAPFTFRDQSRPGRPVAGYNVDLLQALLAPSGGELRITLLPWKRCLADAARGDYDLVLDAVRAKDREALFTYPRSHYRITPIALYRRAAPPPPIHKPEDLVGLDQCRVQGVNYSLLGMTPTVESRSLPATARGALAMLRAGRCKLMIWDEEMIAVPRQASHGALTLDAELAYVHLPWLPKVSMYFMVSRASRQSARLVRWLDEGIATLQRSGEAARLHEPYRAN
ncbi:transporter substrate-binding domain-containing protein [Pelomonas sp. SE-A7]|uniref:substrate-binding periplasmic protein n=1 Tax=Pelomonas sp. SE-A7 TaxID=3054953 RepID=UPI00259D1F64|nr:transporter substrate-binding domain-containing protein [Pelomonas sp. SE-A7]MDM4767242.1 transporter substrate-binding domain-containing protein [Pelomonas sp. SE-A7]